MSIWYEKEPKYTENTNCPICGKSLSKCNKAVQLVGVGEFMKIFTCSNKCRKEFIKKIWELSKECDKGGIRDKSLQKLMRIAAGTKPFLQY